MKITFDRAKFAQTLLFVKNSIPKKEIEPILNNIYLKTLPDGKVQLVSTDLDLMAVAYVPATIDQEGEMTVPGQKLISLVGKLSGEKITLELVDTDINITCGSYSGVFKTAGTESYPTVREILDQPKVIVFTKASISQAFKRIRFAVNEDEARKNLMAVQITHNGMVATNGKVTALYREDFGIDELYISSNCLTDLIAVVESSPAENIEVYGDDAYLIFKLGEDIFFTRKTSVKFPDVFGKIDAPTKDGNNKKIKFKVKDLKSAINRIALTASDESRAIRIKLTAADYMEISSEDSKGFSGKETIPVVTSGVESDFSILFNYEYVVEILGKYATEDIEFRVNDNIRMPVRVDEGKFTAFLMQLVG